MENRATKAALRGKKGEHPKGTTANPIVTAIGIDAKRTIARKKNKKKTLKTSETKDFYRKQLEEMGYKIISVNADRPDYVEYEIVKANDTYEVQIDIDKNSGKATRVDVAPNIWHAEATENALEQAQKR